MTNLSRLSTVSLVDQLGALKAQQAELKKREAQIKSVLEGRVSKPMGYEGDRWVGSLFEVTRSISRRATLDAARIREMFKATGAEVPEKVSISTRWDVKARKVEAA